MRSTIVPIADRPVPMIRSPSQCPGTARSAASAGRPVRDLLRAPRHRPPSILPVRLVQPLPCRRLRPDDDTAVGTADVAGKALLDILTQPVIRRERRHLWAFRRLLRLPLRHERPVLRLPATSRRVPAQLAGDRPRVTTDTRSHALLRGAQQRDLLSLLEGQVTTGGFGQ